MCNLNMWPMWETSLHHNADILLLAAIFDSIYKRELNKCAPDILASGIFPLQILLEYPILNFPTFPSHYPSTQWRHYYTTEPNKNITLSPGTISAGQHTHHPCYFPYWPQPLHPDNGIPQIWPHPDVQWQRWQNPPLDTPHSWPHIHQYILDCITCQWLPDLSNPEIH